MYIFANSADPDEMAHSKQPHQELHYLPLCYGFLTKALFATMDVSKLRDGRVHFRNSGMKGLSTWTFFAVQQIRDNYTTQGFP